MKKADLAVHQHYLVKDGEYDTQEGYLLDLDPGTWLKAKHSVGELPYWRETGHNKVVIAVRPISIQDGEVSWGYRYSSERKVWKVRLIPLNQIIEPLDHAEYVERVRSAYESHQNQKAEIDERRAARRAELQSEVEEANFILESPIFQVDGSDNPRIRLRAASRTDQGWDMGVTMEDLVGAILKLGYELSKPERVK